MADVVGDTEEENYATLCKELEQQELDSPGGVATAQLYGQLLAVYLLKRDLANAKFLWKRIPASLKTANPELAQIWLVGQKQWLKDLPGSYEALNRDWSESLKPIMNAVGESTRRRAFTLGSSAYSSISAADFASFVGMPVNDAVEAAKARGWQYDKSLKFLTPVMPVKQKESHISSEQHLSRLTDFVSFLEN
jgi:COP9 signalosome complex subunit 8